MAGFQQGLEDGGVPTATDMQINSEPGRNAMKAINSRNPADYQRMSKDDRQQAKNVSDAVPRRDTGYALGGPVDGGDGGVPDDQQQMAANIPAKPAGSGEQPFPNPKLGPVGDQPVFGKRADAGAMSTQVSPEMIMAAIGTADDALQGVRAKYGLGDQASAGGVPDQTQSFDDGGAVQPQDDDSPDNSSIGALVRNGVSNAIYGGTTRQAPEPERMTYGASPGGIPVSSGKFGADPGPAQGASQGKNDPNDEWPGLGTPEGVDPSTASGEPGGAMGGVAPTRKYGQSGLTKRSTASDIISYLRGVDATEPQKVAATEQQVDPDGSMDHDTRYLMATHAAAQAEGPEAAQGMVQHYRKKADMLTGYAAAQLAAGNLGGAASAATDAHANILDGTKISFTPSADGVTATVMKSGTSTPLAEVQLNRNQFNQWLRDKKTAGFDALHETGAVATLQKISQGPGLPPQGSQFSTPSMGNSVPSAQAQGGGVTSQGGAAAAQQPQSQTPPAGPRSLSSGIISAPLPGEANRPGLRGPTTGPTAATTPSQNQGDPEIDRSFDADTVKQAKVMFPGGYGPQPGAGQRQRMLAWLAEQGSTKSEQGNKLDIARQQGINKTEEAKIRYGVGPENANNNYQRRTDAHAATDQAKAQAQIAVQQMKTQAQDPVRKQNLELAGKYIASHPFEKPEDVVAAMKTFGIPMPQAAATTPQGGGPGGAPAAPAPAPAPAPAQGGAPQRKMGPDGKWYVRGPNGKAVLDPNQ